jgi:hypothetical protein
VLGFSAEDRGGADPAALGEMLGKRRQDYFDSQDGMAVLARETGGLFLRDDNDMNHSIRQVLDDQAGYYLIGYHPDPKTWDEQTGQPKFHRVRVRVKRPGLTVRSRNGFLGLPDRQGQQPGRTRDQQLLAALTSPFAAGDVRLKLTSLFSNGAKTGSFIRSLLHIDARALTFEEEPEDWHKAVADLVVITFGDNGQEVDRSNRTYTMRLHGDAYKLALSNGFIYSVNHAVKKPGAYHLRVAVRDAGSGRVGSASQFIEVPDVNKGRLALSGIVLNQFRPDTRPADTGSQEGRVEEPDPMASPAVRIFKAGKALTYGYQIINAKPGAGKLPNLIAQMRLYRDGKQVFAGKPAAVDASGQPASRRILAGGRLQLGARLQPGEYVLQVVVTDSAAREKYRTATQWIDFEVSR